MVETSIIDQDVVRKSPETKTTYKRDIIPRELLNLSPNLIIVLDSAGTIVEVNSYAGVMLKSTEYKMLGELFYDLCIPD